jgi:hypothetical protein
MKKLSLVVSLFAIIFSSCSKQHGTDENFHFNFTENGVNKSYTGNVLAHRDTVGNYYSITILGSTTATSLNDYMGIYMDNDPVHGSFSAGEYTDNSPSFSVVTTYNKNGIEYKAGQSVAIDGVYYGIPIAHHFKVTITSINSNTIRGTFSGDFYKDGNVQSTDKLNITNGDFYAQFR